MDINIRQLVIMLSGSRRRLLKERIRMLALNGRQSGGRLIGAVVGNDLDGEDLRSFCESRLPPYMVPQLFAVVADLPKTPAGKVDRLALQHQNWASDNAISEEIVQPSTPTEEKLAAIWRDVLGFDVISVHDDFFEVGGDSLLTIRILSRAAKVGLIISPDVFFGNPTIAGQAASIQDDSGTQLDSGVSNETTVPYDLALASFDADERASLSAQLDALDDD